MSIARALRQGVRPADLAIFYRQMASLLAAGIPLLQALEQCRGTSGNRSLRAFLAGVIREVARGGGLVEALAAYPLVIPPLHASILRLGEEGGRLDDAFHQLAGHTETRIRIRRSFVSAAIYPILVALVALFVLPLPALFARGLSAYLRFNLLPLAVFGAVTGGLVWVLRLGRAAAPVRRLLESVLLGIPVAGPIARRLGLARFCRTLAAGFRAGLEMPRVVDLAAASTGLAGLGGELRQAWQRAERRGTTLVDEITPLPGIPPMLLQFLRVGEQTGDLDGMADRGAQYLEEETTARIQRLTALAGPALLMLVALFLGLEIVRGWRSYFATVNQFIPGGQ